MVRPTWQVEPPKQPDLSVDWMSVGIATISPDTYSFTQPDSSGAYQSQRQETVEIQCSIYGPNAFETYGLLRDGFQIPPNLAALATANMGFTEITEGRHVPDLVNERYIDRIVTTVLLRREIQRTYPVLTILSASGIIYVPDINADYLLAWKAQP